MTRLTKKQFGGGWWTIKEAGRKFTSAAHWRGCCRANPVPTRGAPQYVSNS
jgi:hypothetical protein